MYLLGSICQLGRRGHSESFSNCDGQRPGRQLHMKTCICTLHTHVGHAHTHAHFYQTHVLVWTPHVLYSACSRQEDSSAARTPESPARSLSTSPNSASQGLTHPTSLAVLGLTLLTVKWHQQVTVKTAEKTYGTNSGPGTRQECHETEASNPKMASQAVCRATARPTQANLCAISKYERQPRRDNQQPAPTSNLQWNERFFGSRPFSPSPRQHARFASASLGLPL